MKLTDELKNKAIVLISVILFINMVSICVLGVKVYRLNEKVETAGTAKYTMYVGLNDKDTYEQIVPTDDAKSIIDKICIKYVDGYTTYPAQQFYAQWYNSSATTNQMFVVFENNPALQF